MKVAVVGGAGAMGSLFGSILANAGVDVSLVDVAATVVDAINRDGLRIEAKSGAVETVHVPVTTRPADVGPVDLALVFVKCYHTEDAIRNAAPLLHDDTTVLSLQNGWGNAPRIAAIVGDERVMVGVTYHSGVLLGPGHVQHAGTGMTFIGELDGTPSERLQRVASLFSEAGLDVTPSTDVLTQIWAKLALNVCTLPTSALLRFYAGQLVEHDGTLALMRALLHEVVAVAHAQNIALDFDERWDAITGLLGRADKGKSSMLQDVEKGRRTEIDVINGAIVAAGERLGIATPHNNSMVWLIKSLEETF
jgi:2-dehydropantoate 2-reductase